MAYALDEALALRLALEDRDAARLARGGASRLDVILAGRGPRTDENGLRYEDPRDIYREVMAARTAESGRTH